ncbi:MAG: hypothetical protein HY735_11570 [Verrucomicrobia bacterium]|nr:hypothetical protein [Verrucomicrobiota bacterium]
MFLPGEVQDDLLRLLFVCCDETIPIESQLVLALEPLYGFDIREIAHRLFASEANLYKRLGRARSRFRELPLRLGELTGEQYSSRPPAVHKILYLVSTEGYLSSHAETRIAAKQCLAHSSIYIAVAETAIWRVVIRIPLVNRLPLRQ